MLKGMDVIFLCKVPNLVGSEGLMLIHACPGTGPEALVDYTLLHQQVWDDSPAIHNLDLQHPHTEKLTPFFP